MRKPSEGYPQNRKNIDIFCPLSMSSSLTSDNDYSFNIDELLHIGTMCKELRKEKDMLQESQSNSAEQIRRLEMDVRLLSEARSADRKYIQNLERELRNCSQEIGYLQDQLSLRNIEANCLGEHVHSLELKLAEARKLHEKASQLRVDLVKSESERFFLMQELENKDLELQNSNLCIEKLEEEISSIALESECEIETMKLDLTGMEQRSVEAKKVQEQTAQEKATMDGLIEGFELQLQDAQKRVRYLEEENRELRETLLSLERNSIAYCQKVEDHSGEWLENKEKYGTQCSSNKLGHELQVSSETGTCEEDLAPLLSRLAVIAETDENIKDEMKKMSRQILEYELLVKQLKDELREEKSKAKEEAEDLTQEMAELRYQITGMLEQECKRRACIEQASLQRIAELEAQVQKEQKNSSIAARNFCEAQRLAESRSKEAHHLRSILEGLRVNLQRTKGCSCGDCIISRNLFENCLDKELVPSENTEELVSTDDARLSLVALPWISEETRDRIGRETPDQHFPD